MKERSEKKDANSAAESSIRKARQWDTIFTVITASIIIALIIAILIGLYFVASYLFAKFCLLGDSIKTWDAVIIASFIAGLVSILHLFLSRWLDQIVKKKNYFFEKRMKSYENIVSFIFLYQKRQGYKPPSDLPNAQAACFAINQQVLLWASKEVQRKWENYLVFSWQQDNNSYQHNAVALFLQIAKEAGQHFKRDGAFDFPALRLFYDTPSISVLPSKNLQSKTLAVKVGPGNAN